MLTHVLDQYVDLTIIPGNTDNVLWTLMFYLKKVHPPTTAEFRGAFIAEVLRYPPEFFVWVDETECDCRDHIGIFGYSLKGVPPVYRHLLVWGLRISTSAKGLVDVEF